MRTLNLMQEEDLPEIEQVLKEALGDQFIKVEMQFQYDTEYEELRVFTKDNVPEVKSAEKIYTLNLEETFGEFSLNVFSQCRHCGQFDHDCVKCSWQDLPPIQYGCRYCKKKYSGDGFEVRGEASISFPRKSRKKVFSSEVFNFNKISIMNWDCCSQKCAEKLWAEWIKKLLNNKEVKRILKGRYEISRRKN